MTTNEFIKQLIAESNDPYYALRKLASEALQWAEDYALPKDLNTNDRYKSLIRLMGQPCLLQEGDVFQIREAYTNGAYRMLTLYVPSKNQYHYLSLDEFYSYMKDGKFILLRESHANQS